MATFMYPRRSSNYTKEKLFQTFPHSELFIKTQLCIFSCPPREPRLKCLEIYKKTTYVEDTYTGNSIKGMFQ